MTVHICAQAFTCNSPRKSGSMMQRNKDPSDFLWRSCTWFCLPKLTAAVSCCYHWSLVVHSVVVLCSRLPFTPCKPCPIKDKKTVHICSQLFTCDSPLEFWQHDAQTQGPFRLLVAKLYLILALPKLTAAVSCCYHWSLVVHSVVVVYSRLPFTLVNFCPIKY